MKSVLTALGVMGKSTCREIAARVGKDVRDMLGILENMEDRGQVNFVNGYWSVSGDDSPVPERKTAVHQIAEPKVKRSPAAVRGEKPEQIDPGRVTELLRQNGSMSTAVLSEAVNRNSRGFGTALRYMAEQGHIVKSGSGKGATWSLPAVAPGIQPEPAEPVADKTITELVDEIPVFVGRADDLLVPTSQGISREIRRTKAKLASLEKLRVAVREIRKHKTTIRELAQ